jgi:hypothetical protein
MAAREPKSTFSTSIQIVGRNSERRGRLEFTTGNAVYYAKGAVNPSIKLTFQQLAELLDREIEYQQIDKDGRLPKGGKDDFFFQTYINEHGDIREDLYGRCALSKMDPRRAEADTYTIASENADQRATKRTWYASISLPMVISILNWYVDKWLTGKKDAARRNKAAVINKEELRRLLLQLLKKLD